MRTIVLLIGLLAGTISCYAQNLADAQVPSVVKNGFKQKFPSAMDVEWELKGDLYEVEFEIGRMDHEAWIDKTGKVVKFKRDIKAADLPAPVHAAITKNYSGYRIDDPERIETAGVVTYKLELKKTGEEWNMLFDDKGKELEKVRD